MRCTTTGNWYIRGGVQPHTMCLVGDRNGTTLLHTDTQLVYPSKRTTRRPAPCPTLIATFAEPPRGEDEQALTSLPLAYVRSGTRRQRLMVDSPAGWGWTCSRATTLSSASWTPGCTTTTLSTASAQVICSLQGSGVQIVNTEGVSRSRKVDYADEGLVDPGFCVLDFATGVVLEHSAVVLSQIIDLKHTTTCTLEYDGGNEKQ